MSRKKLSSIAASQIRTESKLNPFGQFKLGESYTSLILGLVVVVIASILIVTFAKNINKKTGNLTQQTLSQKTEEIKSENKNITPGQFYTVTEGDDLWSISEKIYKDGYKWVAIAKENKIENPDIITSGLKLKLPKIAVASAQEKLTQTKEIQVKQENTGQVESAKSIQGSSYKVQRGDFLWEIAVRAYGDGYKWTEIAKANNLAEPNLIFSGNTLKIPR